MAQLNPVTPLYSPSVTATNGSDIIAVTGNVDCSFVRSGTTVFITGRQPVRVISGTAPNGSGNSTIKLKVAWPYATTTGELLAINTYEGLSDAIYQLSVLIDAAEANKNKVFEYKGSYDLAAAGALPPAPESGSAMYRISTQATVASRLYRVGEPIYYDNLTSQWRSMWDGLSGGAYKEPTSSESDITAGRLLQVGAGHQQLDASLYRKGNIVGTVSQSAGVPTGAIIERGSNANGSYVIFADGSCFCRQVRTFTGLTFAQATPSFFVTQNLYASFPVVFIETPATSETALSETEFLSCCATAGIYNLTTQWSLRISAPTTTPTTQVTVTLFAFGRVF